MEKIADYLVYIKDGEIILNQFLDDILNQYQIVKDDPNQLDNELIDLTHYIEYNHTGFTALTTHANVFKELFGSDVAITNPTIEELMVYLEKGQRKHKQYSDGII